MPPRAARATAAGASNSVDGTVGKPSARLAFAASKRSFKRLLEGSRDRAYSRFPTLSFLRLLKNSLTAWQPERRSHVPQLGTVYSWPQKSREFFGSAAKACKVRRIDSAVPSKIFQARNSAHEPECTFHKPAAAGYEKSVS